jgi:hypothetical protein
MLLGHKFCSIRGGMCYGTVQFCGGIPTFPEDHAASKMLVSHHNTTQKTSTWISMPTVIVHSALRSLGDMGMYLSVLINFSTLP